MAVYSKHLTEEECYLLALIQDDSGIDLAEFLWEDPMADNIEGLFRCWDFQYAWWRNTFAQGKPLDKRPKLTLDQCSRAVGKSQSIILRGWAFPIQNPGAEMVITAPEAVHLQPIVSRVEDRIKGIRLSKELLPNRPGMGFRQKPFQADFKNGAKILGRIPQRDGKGVKGCVVEGTMILRSDGYVPVEELVPGDLVLTHTGQWKPVISVHEDVNDCFEVRGQGSYPLTVSIDHSFLGAVNLAGPKQSLQFSETSWFDVEDLDNVYWALPTNFGHMPVPPIGGLVMGEDFWWIVGRWLADGHLAMDKKNHKASRVGIYSHQKDHEEIFSRLVGMDQHYWVRKRSSSTADQIEFANIGMYHWLEEHFGRGDAGKKVPGFVLSMPEFHRRAMLEGYLSGDGHWNEDKMRYEYSSASQALALGVQALAHSVGYVTAGMSVVIPKSQFTDNPLPSYRGHIRGSGHLHDWEGNLLGKVKSVKPVGKMKVYNPVVEEDHSYISSGVISHNLHPLHLEMDEAQDYPLPGWIELVETLRSGVEGSQWRAHGVSRGVRDEFYRHSQPGSGWTVHNVTGMHRPDWTDQEREEKILLYGGTRDSADYKRNILGVHGDATNPLFVLDRLMRCVVDPASGDPDDLEYNDHIYYSRRISYEMLSDHVSILDLIQIPGSHKKWERTWAGMDVGLTDAPSEILVFGQEMDKKYGEVIRLLSRIHLERIRSRDQRIVIEYLFDEYNLDLFTMDRGGVGFPLFQELQDGSAKRYKDKVVGYTADEKLVVGHADYEEFDDPKDFEIRRTSKEFGYDSLRELVDQRRIILPWDTELLGEWQGQTYVREKSSTSPYGTKSYARGSFHTLDAAAMMIVGKRMLFIDGATKAKEQYPPAPIMFA